MNLEQAGYKLIASKPNADGYCMFKVFDSDGCEVAAIDRPCTLDEALFAARAFVENELEEKEKE